MLLMMDDGKLEFPRSVFVSPGDQIGGGYSFSVELVNDQDEYDAAIKAGFFPTVPEAVEAFKNAPEAPKRGRPAKSEV